MSVGNQTVEGVPASEISAKSQILWSKALAIPWQRPSPQGEGIFSAPGHTSCAAGLYDLYLSGHAPDKYTPTRQFCRSKTAKPARRPGPNCRRESSECNERFPDSITTSSYPWSGPRCRRGTCAGPRARRQSRPSAGSARRWRAGCGWWPDPSR